ncbi:DNA polymerase I [Phaeovibrio sulfidiphilus]|uniref:DNA polymerase I n=1 Tax=Phaeovibrio sulfidiphilus TaxID=1220600 RepID=A0A8J6YL87_9PROT|nr:DNA polymerase I [Phaeovibrio sulfidiphilus]MBE1236628.1 DNA polymerase I [Phaeovibrio sulfidiphilus]
MTAAAHLMLIDGSGYIFRAYHSLPPMSRTDGTPVGAVYGFTNMLIKFLNENRATHIAVIFDAGRATFRNEIYSAYKAHRPDPPEDLIPQFPLVREAVRAFGLPCLEQKGFEADDLIATLTRRAREENLPVTIVSSDKDLMQLVGDGVDMLDPMTSRSIGPQEVEAKFGVPPDKVVDVQALAGDSVDNVPGVPGIGVKTAAQLIIEYGDLATLLQKAEEIKQKKRRENLIEFAEAARVSRDLVRLRDDVPLELSFEDFRVRPPEFSRVRDFLETNSFRSLAGRAKALCVESATPEGATAGASAAPEASGAGAASSGSTGSAAGSSTVAPASASEGPVPGDMSPVLRKVIGAPDDYHLVTTIDELDDWLDQARLAGTVGIDTETDSLDTRKARLVGVSLAVAPGRACYIPFAHRSGGSAQGNLLDGPEAGGADPASSVRNIEDAPQALIRLAQFLQDETVLKVGHNIKYDLHVLIRAGLPFPAPLEDTMVLSYVLDGTTHRHGLDELARLHLGRTTTPFGAVCTGVGGVTSFDLVPLDQARDYAAEDADITLRLYMLLRDRLVRDRLVRVYETIDRPMIPTLARMEEEGVCVDAPRLRELSADFSRAMADLEAEIHALARRSFNVGSPRQLGEILFDEMKLEGGKRSSKTGAWSTDAQILEQLAGEGHELPRKVLDWRGYQKLKSTYTDALVRDIDPRTGRVHTTYSLTVTSTGRLSSVEPNLQNIPIRTEDGRKIREAFVAAEGMKLLSADYSQIELRLVAHVAGVSALREAFARGDDIHAITASEVFGVPVEGMDPVIRRQAKAINFGIIYGISAHGLALQLGISRSEAARFIEAYLNRFPEITAYMEATKEYARTHGFVKTPLGRRIPVPGINDTSPPLRAFAERQAINAPIQGGAADIIKRAMVRLPGALEEVALTGRMLLQVHDELVFEVPEVEVDFTIPVIRRIMEQTVALTDERGVTTVPLVVDVGVGDNWASAH